MNDKPKTYYVMTKEEPDRVLITGMPKGTQVMNQFAIHKRLPNNKIGWFIYHIPDADILEKNGRVFLARHVSPDKIFYYDFGEWIPLETLYP